MRRWGGPGIVDFMPARPAHEPAPDLFRTAATTKTVPPETPVIAPKVAAKSVPSAQRHLLPKDLPGALAHLDDVEIVVLLAAVIEEAKRRDRPLPGLTVKSHVADQHPRGVSQSKMVATYARVHPGQARADEGAACLTRGQVNAIRAAFKAGVKPSMIARQFRVSQSDIRRVLASQGQERKL